MSGQGDERLEPGLYPTGNAARKRHRHRHPQQQQRHRHRRRILLNNHDLRAYHPLVSRA
jgi:hypothetical protein